MKHGIEPRYKRDAEHGRGEHALLDCEPAPLANTSGIVPMTKLQAVIITARYRLPAPDIAASTADRPDASS